MLIIKLEYDTKLQALKGLGNDTKLHTVRRFKNDAKLQTAQNLKKHAKVHTVQNDTKLYCTEINNLYKISNYLILQKNAGK